MKKSNDFTKLIQLAPSFALLALIFLNINAATWIIVALYTLSLCAFIFHNRDMKKESRDKILLIFHHGCIFFLTKYFSEGFEGFLVLFIALFLSEKNPDTKNILPEKDRPANLPVPYELIAAIVSLVAVVILVSHRLRTFSARTRGILVFGTLAERKNKVIKNRHQTGIAAYSAMRCL